MDGDFALLAELVALRKQHEFLLVIDEVFDIPVSRFYTLKDLFRHNVGAT